MTAALSNTQIDKLGNRLRKGSLSESDLRDLDEYRLSFGAAYEIVVRTLQSRLRLKPTGRPAKSTRSLVEKLNRESVRLVQVQDIAGCRVVVPNIAQQERAVAALRREFAKVHIIDRREIPSYGYRAVHVVVDLSGKLVEIQVRTALQHMWAELSEKLSDVLDASIKYGGGDKQARDMLTSVSDAVKTMETNESAMIGLRMRLAKLPRKERNKRPQQALLTQIRTLEKDMARTRKRFGQTLAQSISAFASDGEGA